MPSDPRPNTAARPEPNGGDPTSQPLLDLRDVYKEYTVGRSFLGFGSRQTVHAVSGVSIEVRKGGTLGVVGESGCGKSTLARLALRLEPATRGTISFEGKDLETMPAPELRELRPRMQIVFQDPYSSLNPARRVESTLSEVLKVHRIVPPPKTKARVAELLEMVGLSGDLMSRYPHEFSGGQRQRIAIARALATEPRLIVCDEPVSALDVSIRAQIINLLKRLQRELGLTYLFIAHDLPVVEQMSDEIAVMYLGKIVEIGDSSLVFQEPLHPYTHSLLEAVPVPDPDAHRHRRGTLIRGEVPSPIEPPTGCRYHTRCWLRSALGNPDLCVTDDPELRAPDGSGHRVACHFAEQVPVQIRSATR